MAGAIMTSQRDDWNTPGELLEPVREFLGAIDLDPCWNRTSLTEPKVGFDLANQGQDGLKLPWGKCRVFVNPPWGRVIGQWCVKAELEKRENGAGIVMLLPANTDTKAWQLIVFPHAEAICFMKGRVAFIDPETGQPAEQGVTKGAAFVYFGRRSYKDFQRVFEPFGHVIGRVFPDKADLTRSTLTATSAGK